MLFLEEQQKFDDMKKLAHGEGGNGIGIIKLISVTFNYDKTKVNICRGLQKFWGLDEFKENVDTMNPDNLELNVEDYFPVQKGSK